MSNLSTAENALTEDMAQQLTCFDNDNVDFDKSIITGADAQQEDILFWFIDNVKRYCPNLPIQVVDFGLSQMALFKLQSLINVHLLKIDLRKNEDAWFNKPRAMLASKSKKTLWLDIDCEVLSDIEDIFELTKANKIGLVDDLYYCANGKEQYNTGVVLFTNKPKILYEWDSLIDKSNQRGDQEVLKEYLDDHPYIKKTETYKLPDKYNCVRLFYQTNASAIEDLRIIHWTGPKGKLAIRNKMKKQSLVSGTKALGHDWTGDENQFRPEETEK